MLQAKHVCHDQAAPLTDLAAAPTEEEKEDQGVVAALYSAYLEQDEISM